MRNHTNPNARQITGTDHLRRFILAGKATFTVKSLRTNTRYTFRVTEGRRPGIHYVAALTGPDNTACYSYIGAIFNKTEFRRTAKSPEAETRSGAAGRWVVSRVIAGQNLPNCEIWHEGECARCGRKLTVPESIESGFGPECSKKI